MVDFEDAWRAEQAVFFELDAGGVGGHVYGEEALFIYLAFTVSVLKVFICIWMQVTHQSA